MAGLLAWAVKRRKKKFISGPKQLKFISQMYKAGITGKDISARWVELEDQDWYQEHGLDFANVANSFDKRPK